MAKITVGQQELFQVEQIDQTKQENRPPLPPKPPIPIEAPSSDVLADIEIGDTEKDINEQKDAPPPEEDKKVVE